MKSCLVGDAGVCPIRQRVRRSWEKGSSSAESRSTSPGREQPWAASSSADVRLRGRMTSSAPPRVWQSHAECSWLERANGYGTMLDKTLNMLLAERDPLSPHSSVLCAVRDAVLQHSCAWRRSCLTYLPASSVPCLEQQEIENWGHFTHCATYEAECS